MKLKVNSFDTTTIQGVALVATFAYFHMEHTDGEISHKIERSFPLKVPADISKLTPYMETTAEDHEAWVREAMGTARMASLEAEVLSEVNKLKAEAAAPIPVAVKTPLPWEMTSEEE